jgi:hypothetical protein
MQLLKLQRRDLEFMRRTRYRGGPSILYFLKPALFQIVLMSALAAFYLSMGSWTGRWHVMLPFVAAVFGALGGAAIVSVGFFARLQMLWNVLEEIIQWDRVDELLDQKQPCDPLQ